ncbi:MAG: DNA (cytosine-5-)-methyltransferase [Nitrosopumilaceae archaeon]
MKSEYDYIWHLKNADFKKDKGKVFSGFAGGGGSTMGYKLAGFDVIGFNEVDKKMAECYIQNHNPKYSYVEPIQKFKIRNNLPDALYDLDILDGSPPCSSFSIAGNRHRDWGKEKQFREGMEKQILDTLFFDFIDLAKKLQSKVVVAENVHGILLGMAKKYMKNILYAFDAANYFVDFKLLDSSLMGVPQVRRRVIFYAIRKDLIKNIKHTGMHIKKPVLDLDFNFDTIFFEKIMDENGDKITKHNYDIWKHRKYGEKVMFRTKKRIGMKASNFPLQYVYKENVMPVIPSTGKNALCLFHKPLKVSETEIIKGSTFPLDYNFCNANINYVCGMSVPPVMMANISKRIYDQWLKNI